VHTNVKHLSRGLLAVASVAVLAFGTGASTVAAGGIVNCVDVTGKNVGRVGCYEEVWSGGVEYRMTFANQAYQGAAPRPLDRFYVLAPQGDVAQGEVPSFRHDHVVRDIPGDGGNTTRALAGYFVLCGEHGLVSGSCSALWQSFGGPAMPFAVHINGQPLTSTEAIEAAAAAGDVVLVDLGPNAVIVGSMNPSK